MNRTEKPAPLVKLTARIWAGADSASLSPGWLAQGHWAIRRDNFDDENLLGLVEGAQQCRLFEHVLRLRRGLITHIRNTTDDTRILGSAFPTARARTKSRERHRYERTPLAYEIKGVVGIVFRAPVGIVVIDKVFADAFRLTTVYGTGGLAVLTDAEEPENCKVLVNPMNPDDAAAAVKASGL